MAMMFNLFTFAFCALVHHELIMNISYNIYLIQYYKSIFVNLWICYSSCNSFNKNVLHWSKV